MRKISYRKVPEFVKQILPAFFFTHAFTDSPSVSVRGGIHPSVDPIVRQANISGNLKNEETTKGGSLLGGFKQLSLQPLGIHIIFLR